MSHLVKIQILTLVVFALAILAYGAFVAAHIGGML